MTLDESLVVRQLIQINEIRGRYLLSCEDNSVGVHLGFLAFLRLNEQNVETKMSVSSGLNLQKSNLDDVQLGLVHDSLKSERIEQINLGQNQLVNLDQIQLIIDDFKFLREINVGENGFEPLRLAEFKQFNKNLVVQTAISKKLIFKQILKGCKRVSPNISMDKSTVKQNKIDSLEEKNKIMKQCTRIEWLLELKSIFEEQQKDRIQTRDLILILKARRVSILEIDQVIGYLEKVQVEWLSFEDIQEFFKQNQDIQDIFKGLQKVEQNSNQVQNNQNVIKGSRSIKQLQINIIRERSENEVQDKETARFNQEGKRNPESLQENKQSLNLSSICLSQKNTLNNTLLDNSIQDDTVEKHVIQKQLSRMEEPFKQIQNTLQSRQPIFVDLTKKDLKKAVSIDKKKENFTQRSTSRNSSKNDSTRSKINYKEFQMAIRKFELTLHDYEQTLAVKFLQNMEVVENRLVIFLDEISFDQKQIVSWQSQLFKDFFKLNQIFKICRSPKIQRFFPDFQQIQILNLSFNQIENLQFLQKNIYFVNLSYNQLQGLNGIEKCLKLKEIHLQNNAITQIENILPLTQLRLINLKNNLLENFEDLNPLINLNRLQSIVLTNNPITFKINYVSNIQKFLNQVSHFDYDNLMTYSGYQKYQKFVFCQKNEILDYQKNGQDLYSSVDSFDLNINQNILNKIDQEYTINCKQI